MKTPKTTTMKELKQRQMQYCRYCGKKFLPKTPSQIFCKPSHYRKMYNLRDEDDE